MRRLYVVVFVLINCVYIKTARILAVFPIPSISHQIVFRPLTHKLATIGHEVTVVTTDPVYSGNKNIGNLKEIDIHNVSYSLADKYKLEVNRKERLLHLQILKLTEFFRALFEVQLNTKELQKLLQKEQTHFDLIIVEACVSLTLIFSHIFKAPLIQISSFGALLANYETLGVPTHPSFYPSSLRHKLYNLTLWDKFQELYHHAWMLYITTVKEYKDNKFLRRIFGSTVPTTTELRNNVHMLFLNTHPIWAMNVPVPPNVIFIGGIHENTGTKLPEDQTTYLESSKKGVIYISFGTNVKTEMINKTSIEVFVEVLSKLPYEVMWKWDQDELPGKSKNIKISKWFSQPSLLKHPKVKLFITQGGLQSIEETIAAGVPIIGFPMMTDQWYNLELCAHFKIGVKLDMDSLTKEVLNESINSVIMDESYRNNVARLRFLMKDQMHPPLERAVWWTEYVLRHKGAHHLRSPAANISWAEYLELKLLSIVFFCVIAIIYFFLTVLKYIYRMIRNAIQKDNKIKVN